MDIILKITPIPLLKNIGTTRINMATAKIPLSKTLVMLDSGDVSSVEHHRSNTTSSYIKIVSIKYNQNSRPTSALG